MKSKVEIINVDLDIDIAEEIKSKVDSLNNKIIEKTQKIIEESGVQIQKINKKKKLKNEKAAKINQLEDVLADAFSTPDLWLTGAELLEAIDIEPSTANVNKYSQALNKKLKSEDKWVLNKKRLNKKVVYRLFPFS